MWWENFLFVYLQIFKIRRRETEYKKEPRAKNHRRHKR